MSTWLEELPQVSEVVVGDTMRISVALIDQIRSEPDSTSIAARVIDIRAGRDGSKVLVLERVKADGG